MTQDLLTTGSQVDYNVQKEKKCIKIKEGNVLKANQLPQQRPVQQHRIPLELSETTVTTPLAPRSEKSL